MATNYAYKMSHYHKKSQLCKLIIISVAVIFVKRWSLFVHSEVIGFVSVTYQAFDAVCHHQMKHPEEKKYDVQRGIFDELRGVSSGDETASNA